MEYLNPDSTMSNRWLNDKVIDCYFYLLILKYEHVQLCDSLQFRYLNSNALSIADHDNLLEKNSSLVSSSSYAFYCKFYRIYILFAIQQSNGIHEHFKVKFVYGVIKYFTNCIIQIFLSI